MLAQNLKTPADLGISDAEFASLQQVLGMLERGEVSHVPVSKSFSIWDWGKAVPIAFNLSEVYGAAECGTTACILGWARYLGRDDQLFANRGEPIQNLFCMGQYDHDTDIAAKAKVGGARNISTALAAQALRNFLTHGEPRWAEVLASD